LKMQFVSFLQQDNGCTKALIKQQVDQCAYVKQACADQSDYLNFLAFYYCAIDQNVPLIILICALFVVVAFQFLGTTADNFLSESLEVVSAKLGISEETAAVTFLALANGAADVITGIVAGGKGQNGVFIAMGGLFGAGLFTVTCVFSRCIQGDMAFKKKENPDKEYEGIEVKPGVMVRDVSFILLAAVYFFIVASVTSFTIPLVCVYLLIYIIFFCVAFYQIKTSKKGPRGQEEKAKSQNALQHENEEDKPLVPAENKKEEEKAKPKSGNVPSKPDIHTLVIHDPDAKNAITKIKAAITKKLESDPEHQKKKAKKQPAALALWQYVYLNTYYSQKIQAKRAMRRARAQHANLDEEELGSEGKNPDEISEEEYADNLWGRFMYRYDQVLLFIRQLTIPQFNEKTYNKWMALATPIFGTCFLAFTFGGLPPAKPWGWGVIFGIAGFLELLTIIFFNVNLAKKIGAIQGLLAFLVSAMWIDLVASCFMDMLALITVISGLPLTFLSLTVLAWGNSMDDFFIDYVVAKKGKGPMAITGVFAGQFFNLILGFGGGMFRLTLKGPVNFGFYAGGNDNAMNVLLICSFIFTLATTLFIAWINKFKLGKKLMYFLMTFYVCFIIACTVLAFV